VIALGIPPDEAELVLAFRGDEEGPRSEKLAIRLPVDQSVQDQGFGRQTRIVRFDG